jgi:UDP-N-acetyl-D-glucosamine dehydrogenase
VYDALAQKIRDRTALVAVIGLGYVGIPLAAALLRAGFRVLGCDVDEQKIESLRAGRVYIGHPAADEIVAAVREGRFDPTADMSRLGEPDALLICVPTPLTASRDPDLTYVEQTIRAIAARLRPGQLVSLESTTYPSTTRNVVLPILLTSGLRAGSDFFLAYSPEREDPGNPQRSAAVIPKVVSGLDAASLELATALYASAVAEVVPVSSLEVAEACKILENTYRAVNIALVNELKVLLDRMGIDIWEVIDAARTKPFGFQAFYPGPGLGGHCIPIDPFYLSWLARQHGLATRFIELAGEVNSRMPEYVVGRLAEALDDAGKPLRGSRVCILGVAYKRDVDDPRESPAFAIFDLLRERGAELSYSDPHVPRLPRMRHHEVPVLASSALTPEFLTAQDAVVIVTDHSAFDYEAIVRHAPLVIDARNATRAVREGREKIRKA